MSIFHEKRLRFRLGLTKLRLNLKPEPPVFLLHIHGVSDDRLSAKTQLKPEASSRKLKIRKLLDDDRSQQDKKAYRDSISPEANGRAEVVDQLT
ncbi:uncharacterized protein LOC107269235 isoform X2 [Cephus cinctus]|uniref:Uncharacterized protein LOC107269235 isoform X2 n=1 Tax=Cephus cinctus TaxID=211228 RepID=A0AAJ7W379_CEPCN|nr:uncharacterized protein LOC107269235 isoform X2 [Cephus cinctus]